MTEVALEEEVSGFALAYVVTGEVDVSATMVDAPAARFGPGSILRGRGSIEDSVALRLIGASEVASVATWREDDVTAAFRACPWVEEDLRAAADRPQALAGVTVGPLGERLDRSLRDQVMSRLDLRVLRAGDVVVEKGNPVPGLVIVGVGELELAEGDAVKQTLGSGEFLFAEAVLGAGPAPLTARAGKGGALAMWASRAVAQELLVTCPPLLELFAGM
jgi:CRP-like cAMP-binding protein